MSFSGGHAAGGTAGSGAINWDQGDFNPNVSGSGVALQAGTSSLLLIAAVVVAAVWLLSRKR